MKSYQLACFVLALLIGVVALSIFFLLVVGLFFGISWVVPEDFDFWSVDLNPNSYVAQALARVKVGDEREQAIQALSDAWYHGVCDDYGDDYVVDLFFYGPKNIKQATVIRISSETQGGKKIVNFIGSPENNELHLYECLPPGFPNDLTATPYG